MEFRILGPLEVQAGGDAVTLGGVRQRGVLAALLLRANEAVPAERLIDLLWGDDAPATAAGTLQAYVSRLRKALRAGAADDRDGRLETVGKGYRLRVEPDEVDLLRFEKLSTSGRRALEAREPAVAAEHLREALGLWRGDALADFTEMPFALPEIARLEELYLSAIEDRLASDLALGRAADVVGELTALVGEHGLRERLRGMLMLALYRTQRQADALAVFEQGREVLADELGLDPGQGLRDLHERILRQDPALLSAAPSSDAAADPRNGPAGDPGQAATDTDTATDTGTAPASELTPRPLPRSHTLFVGREHETAHLHRLVAEAGVVAVVGPGGVGKSRLIMDVVRTVAETRPAVYVGLAAVGPGGLGHALLEAVGCEGDPGGDDLRSAGRLLANSNAIVVLDDADHVATDAVAAATALRDAGEALTVVITSRVRLDVNGERVIEVGPLSGGPGGDAAELFQLRATAAGGLTEQGDGHDDVIADIVERLDGIPLAIELAAARTTTLSLDELRTRLDEHLEVLGARHDGPERHRTLDASIAWSVTLLDPEEQALLRNIAIFPGGCTVTAAERVATACDIEPSDVLELLSRLVGRSLVVVADGPDGRRYRMLRTVRAHALGQLAEHPTYPDVRRAFAAWARDLAERGRDGLHQPDRDAWRRRLDGEHGNLLFAIEDRLDAARPADALAIAVRMWPYWRRVGWVREGMATLTRCREAVAAANHDVPDNDLASAHHGLGALAMLCSDFDGAKAALETAVTLAATDLHRAWIRTDLGTACVWSGEHDRADELLPLAVTDFETLGHVPGEAAALRALARLRGWQGAYLVSRQLAERALILGRQVDDARAVADAGAALAIAHANLGDSERAQAAARDAVLAARPAGDRDALLLALYSQALVASVAGDRDVSLAAAEEVMALSGLLSLPGASVPALVTLGRIAALDGDNATARVWFGDALERSKRAGMPENVTLCALGLARSSRRDGDVHGARVALATAAAVTADRELQPRIREVLDEAGLQAMAAGDDARAAQLFAVNGGLPGPYLRTLDDAAEVAAAAGSAGQAPAPDLDATQILIPQVLAELAALA